MIRGQFAETHPARSAPYEPTHPPVPIVNATVWIPELGTQRDPRAALLTPFLVDTGADMTVLHPTDSKKLFRTPAQWQWVTGNARVVLGGAGQQRPHYEMSAYVLLTHTDETVDYRMVMLYVPEPHAGIAEVESLLGRDVLAYYRTTFDRNVSLTLETPA